MGQEVLQVQPGIWIDEQWIQDAGLEGRLRILVQPGEIRILSGTEENKPKASSRGGMSFALLGMMPSLEISKTRQRSMIAIPMEKANES